MLCPHDSQRKATADPCQNRRPGTLRQSFPSRVRILLHCTAGDQAVVACKSSTRSGVANNRGAVRWNASCVYGDRRITRAVDQGKFTHNSMSGKMSLSLSFSLLLHPSSLPPPCSEHPVSLLPVLSRALRRSVSWTSKDAYHSTEYTTASISGSIDQHVRLDKTLAVDAFGVALENRSKLSLSRSRTATRRAVKGAWYNPLYLQATDAPFFAPVQCLHVHVHAHHNPVTCKCAGFCITTPVGGIVCLHSPRAV
ncbi:hypothetical protein BC835DRAFT_89679 [Cytidiella melzeri]|nr:hypothetical protein BC835DRAFT_89679 [Cytidiella melzeri]